MDISALRRVFAARIKKLRGSKMNQGEFADSVGISRGAMSYYEQEARTPDIGVLRAICVKYNISADYLLGIIPDPNHSVADVCRETSLSPEAARKLRLMSRIIGTDVNSYEEMMDVFDDDFVDVMKLVTFSSVPQVLNILLESDEGLELLILLGAIILGADIDGEQPMVKVKSAVKHVEVSYPIENLAAALWVNIQNNAEKIKHDLRAGTPQTE